MSTSTILTKADFIRLLQGLSAAWSRRDYPSAIAFFSEQVRYADPLRYRLEGHSQLLSFFEADEGYAQFVEWHTILFDEQEQKGMAEYTYQGTYRYHGVAIIRVQAGKITHWREYQHIDPRDWQEFVSGTAF